MKLAKKTISFFMVICICFSFCACGTEYEQYTLLPNQFLLGERLSDTGEIIIGEDGVLPQLTAEDIMEMNNGDAHMVFNDAGYLTFLDGTYYDGIIKDQEDAVASLQGIALLLGLGEGSNFFCEYGEKNNLTGYTYYTFKQRYGEGTEENGTLKVIIDPEGHAAGLACSFTPNLGYAEPVDWISPEQAEQVVSSAWGLQTYSEYTQKVAITFSGTIYSAYAIYTDSIIQEGKEAGLPYLVHYVNWDGSYLVAYSTSYLSGSPASDSALSYFDGKQASTYTGNIVLCDGSVQRITVPTAYDPQKGVYYLMDTERKIAVGDYASFFYKGFVNFSSSTDGQVWDNNHLIAYYNYIRVYDYYAQYGIYSTDGTGVPILICCDWVTQDGTPYNNAASAGILQGFATFSMSDANYYAEAVDVIAHEFTHGVSGYMRGGDIYMNETGAINEALSDIMGNVIEMSLGATTDTSWLVGEMGNAAIRSMSNPQLFGQPVSKDDKYYMQPVPEEEATQENDLGGVHQNSSLLSQMAYKLYTAGMPLEDISRLFVGSMGIITPRSGYKEVHAALLMTIEVNGFDEKYGNLLTEAFQEAGLID